MKTRLKYLAGSEIGACAFTAGTLPEEKAAELRLEVTVPAVDRLVALAQADPDVFGARMTGGGFGGGIVALARGGCGAAVARRVVDAYGPQGKVGPSSRNQPNGFRLEAHERRASPVRPQRG